MSWPAASKGSTTRPTVRATQTAIHLRIIVAPRRRATSLARRRTPEWARLREIF
jgi:hypothetical protein